MFKLSNPKILIGTLYSGENEFDECVESVKRQTYKNVEHIFFKYLPNKEAHNTLYRTFMERADEFDYFLKLDADMVFNTDEALEIILDYFDNNPELDHMVTAVDDRYSDTLIMGLHAFSNRVKWEQNDENLFVDHRPSIPGERKLFWDFPAPLVKHCPNPSYFQAYHFGVHRALKAFQPERSNFNGNRSLEQWKLIRKIGAHFDRTEDLKLGYCILGVEHVIQGEVSQNDYSEIKRELLNNFSKIDSITSDELSQVFGKNWNGLVKKDVVYLRKVIFRMLIYKILKTPKFLITIMKRI